MRWLARIAALLGAVAAAPMTASARVFLAADDVVTFNVLDWRFTCSGYSPHFTGCYSHRRIGRARLDIAVSRTETRFELHGSCRDRNASHVAIVAHRPGFDFTEYAHAIDGLFVEQYDGCDNPLSWPVLRTADQVVYFMYQLVRLS